jgi:hypothetical protein
MQRISGFLRDDGRPVREDRGSVVSEERWPGSPEGKSEQANETTPVKFHFLTVHFIKIRLVVLLAFHIPQDETAFITRKILLTFAFATNKSPSASYETDKLHRPTKDKAVAPDRRGLARLFEGRLQVPVAGA